MLVAVLSAISFAVAAVLTHVEHRYAFYLIPARFWELGLGMLLCLTSERWSGRLASAAPWARLSIVLASLASIAVSFVLDESTLFPFPLALLPVLGTLGLIAVVKASPHDRITTMLATTPLVTIGKLSYSLYLWHWPVVVGLRWTVGLESHAMEALALVLTAVLGWLSFMFVERPLRYGSPISRMPQFASIALALGCIIVCTGVTRTIANQKPALTLSVTKDKADWEANGKRPLIAANVHCKVMETTMSLAGGMRMTWTPSDCDGPGASQRSAGHRVIALGDSHNLMFRQSYRQLASDLGIEVRMYWKSECPYVRMDKPQDAFARCNGFFDEALPEIYSNLRSGDVVYLHSLLLPRLTEQYRLFALQDALHTTQLPRDAALADAKERLGQFTERGARVIITAPTPLMSAPPFRCSDWFNNMNPVCVRGTDTDRALLDDMRRPVISALDALASADPGVTVWDSFDELCPGKICRSSDRGHPLFFDGDHLSGYGVAYIYPRFRKAMIDALKGDVWRGVKRTAVPVVNAGRRFPRSAALKFPSSGLGNQANR